MATLLLCGNKSSWRLIRQLLWDVDTQNVVFSIGPTGQTIELTIDGNTFDLVSVPNSSSYAFNDATHDAIANRIFSATDSLDIVYVGYDEYDATGTTLLESSGGYLPIGFLSGPTVASRQTGSATYAGYISIAGSSAAGVSYGQGDLTLNVDFDGNTLSGGAAIADTRATNAVSVPISQIDIPETSFENGLAAGAITVVATDPTQNLVNGEFDAALYGSQGNGLGGTMSGEIVDGVGNTKHSFQGAFATSR